MPGDIIDTATRAGFEYSNIRILEYENSIRILMTLFEYLKLFEYCQKSLS